MDTVTQRPLRPLVDTNSVLAIESIFSSHKDVWGADLAAHFADVFIYSDCFRFTVSSASEEASDDPFRNAPRLVKWLRDRDRLSVAAELVPNNAEPIHERFVDQLLAQFAAWAQNNRTNLRRWLVTHSAPGTESMQRAQVGRRYYYDLEPMLGRPLVLKLAKELGIPPETLLYAFDNVARTPLYGRLTGADQYYLNHPMRNVALFPTFETRIGAAPPMALSFKTSVARLLDQLSFEEYVETLSEWRATIRDRSIHLLRPGDIEPETVRELASLLRLPPRLKGTAKSATVLGAFLSGVGAMPTLGPIAAVIGVAVSVSTAVWDGTLPRDAARVSWLRWFLEWDIENQEARRP